MTDIERAIRSCENKIRKYQKSLAGANFHRPERMNSIYLERVKISALRAQQDVPDTDVGKKHGWISVKDRLPEPNVEVLLIAHGWNNREIYVGKLQRIEAGTSWLTGLEAKASDWTIWGFSYLKEPVVTHWMPLPEPQEEDEAK